MDKKQELELSDSGEQLEALIESKSLEIAKGLIAQKYAAAQGKEANLNTVNFVRELNNAGAENFDVEDVPALFNEMRKDGYQLEVLVQLGVKVPMSWKIVSAPPIEAGPVNPVVETNENGLESGHVEEPITEAASPAELLRDARLSALEKYIDSLGAGVEFTGKEAQAALQTDELENPKNAATVALLARLEKAGKIRHLGGDKYAAISEKQEYKSPREVVEALVEHMAAEGKEILLPSDVDEALEAAGLDVAREKGVARLNIDDLVTQGILRRKVGAVLGWDIVPKNVLLREALKKKIVEGEFKTDAQILDILAENTAEITPAIMRDGLAAAGITMSLADVEGSIFPALAAQGLIAETSVGGIWAVNAEVLAAQQGKGKETKPQSEVKNGSETFDKMVEALATLPDETDVEGIRVAFKAAGLAGTMEEVLLALPGLAREGLLTETEPGTWVVQRAEVAKRQKSAETGPATEATEAEKLAAARIQAIEAYIQTQADAGGEITQAGALAVLEADAAMGAVTDLDVYKIFEDLEKAGKIKFISNGKYERVVPEDAKEDEGEAEKKERELFEARLAALAVYVAGKVGGGEITIAAAKQALEGDGHLGDNIPEADIEKLFAELVADGTVRALDNGNYEAVSDDEEESAESFTDEQMNVVHKWLKQSLNKPSVRFIDVKTLGDLLAKAGLAKAGAAALLAQLEADGLLSPLTKGRSWKLNKDAIRDMDSDSEDEEAESAADFYERTGVLKSDLVAFARDVLGLPHMAAGIVKGKYTGQQLQDIFDEYEVSQDQGGAYLPPSMEAWDAFPDEDLLGDGREDEEEPEPGVAEKKPGFFGKLFGKKKSNKKPARAERADAEASDSADIAAWKASRRGKSFINSLTELNGDLLGVQDYFDQDSEVDVEQAMIAQEMFDTHYAQVRNIFDRQLEAMTGYSMYDIFNLGEEGQKMYADFGKWVVRQSYLDAKTPQGRGRLEKIISLDASVQENASFLATVVSPQRLQELQDRRDDWKTAYKITRVTSGDARDARDRLGKAVPEGWFAEVKGIRKARRYDEYVQEVEENFERAPEVKAEIAEQRRKIIAELDSMNGLIDAEQDKTSPASGFAKMLRSMIDKIGSSKTPAEDAEITQTDREKAEEAERVLQAVRKVQAQREAVGASAYAFYDEQEQNKADFEIRRLEADVTKLVQKEFAKALEAKINAGKAKGIIDFRAETIMTIERLAGNLACSKPRREAAVAIAKVLEEQASKLEKTNPEGPKAEVLKELNNSITLLRKRIRQ